MKTLYFTYGNNNIWVDTDAEETGRLERMSSYHIDGYYLVTEPMHVICQYGEDKQEIDVKKGDIIAKWDNGKDVKNYLTVIKSKGMFENFKNFIDAEQKRKEEWALKEAQKDCDGCTPCDAAA